MDQVTADTLADEIKNKPQRVVVTNLDMEFGTMVWFLVKLAIASIPAVIILTLIGMVVVGIISGLLSGML